MAASQSSDLLGGNPSNEGAPSDNIATALSSTGSSKPAPQSNNSNDTNNNRWGSMVGGLTGSIVNSARSAVNTVAKQTSDLSSSNSSNPNSMTASTTTQSSINNTNTPTSGSNAFFTNLTSNISTSVSSATNSISASSTFKSITNNIAGRNTMPDKTTASQVLMFRQLLHTKCRPGLRLSRVYQGTAAQKAVLHMVSIEWTVFRLCILCKCKKTYALHLLCPPLYNIAMVGTWYRTIKENDYII